MHYRKNLHHLILRSISHNVVGGNHCQLARSLDPACPPDKWIEAQCSHRFVNLRHHTICSDYAALIKIRIQA